MQIRWTIMGAALATAALLAGDAKAQPGGRPNAGGATKPMEDELAALKAKVRELEAKLAEARPSGPQRGPQGGPARGPENRPQGGPPRGPEDRPQGGPEADARRGPPGEAHHGPQRDARRGPQRDARRGPQDRPQGDDRRGPPGGPGRGPAQSPGDARLFRVEQKLDRLLREVEELKRASRRQ
jgi:hypothetical protein